MTSDLQHKRALRKSVDGSPHPMSWFADQCGVSLSTFAEWCDDRNDDKFIPVRRLLALLPLLGDLSILDDLESRVNRVASVVPTGLGARPVAHVVGAFGAWLTTHGKALDDGQWTRADAEDCERQARDVMAALAGVIDAAKDAASKNSHTSKPQLRAVEGK